MKLWDITTELEMLGDEIQECGGELTPLMEQRLDALEGAFEDKVERVALYVREMIVSADAAKAEETRLAAIRRSHERTADGLKRYLQTCLERAGVPKINTPKVKVRVQRNSQPSCM
ncbi:MAG: siphovirus Gp157 family protein, partial [Gemmatimonadaceae bacterium]|nr:siphovirus Gp157 family protein [Gemmatimonadaceae bacterium]